ncbi:MAG: hypothetical protein NUV73_04145 [Candidatus Daviesbacteria bacterium]|nr:hypothetical protein [Candidatus Daviesbacteria bacterium]
MATYDPNSLGIKAPAGGFKEGGWYNGRQFWGGTLSDPGVIHELSNQQGAGQAVSQEVVAQTNPANVGYVNQQRQQQKLPALNNSTNPATFPGGDGSAAGAGAGTGIPGGVGFNQPTIDLPSIYDKLYESSGVKGKQEQLFQYDKDFAEATGKINDNPFLAEATRVGRIAKLDDLYQKRTANLRGEIASAKADVETQLALQTKQFDINSEQARLALDQFNTLLGLGAFDGASGEDIAQITRSTGLSSSMINSAINANKQKNVQTSTIQFDDGTNQGYAVINSQTGEIISKQTVAQSKPKATGSGKLNESEVKATNISNAKKAAQQGASVSQLFNLFTGYLDADLIYQIYNSNSKYGPDKGDISKVAQYGVKQPDY